MDELKNDEAQSSGDSSLVTPNFPSFSEKTEVDDSKMGDRNDNITQNPPVAVGRSRAKTLSAETLERMNKGIIDTAQPIDSVKSAVSKFGGIVDWKAHKVMFLEKRTHIQTELEKIQEDIPKYKKKSESAQIAKDQVLEELDSTKKLIEDLKDTLEKTEIEEAQAKQDSELAQLRVKEMEQGISSESSAAAKAQVEVAKARHQSAIEELRTVKLELESLQGDYSQLVIERNFAVQKAEKAVSVAKDADKKTEDLTLELISIKEALESAHASHLEVEEHRIALATARDQELLVQENELNQANKEFQKLSDQQASIVDLKTKFENATIMLMNLKTELAFYMEGKKNETSETQVSVTSELASAKKELEEVKITTQKRKEEINFLKEAASSIKAELDRESEALTTLRQREEVSSVTVSSLEAELTRMQLELELVLTKEKEAREKMEGLPKLVQQANVDADQAKSVADLAREELRRAKEEAEQAKAGAITMETRLLATLKEIEAANASEALAVTAVKTMIESDKKKNANANANATDEIYSDDQVTLQLEEYYALSKKAHDAEELANERVISAVEKIKQAKNCEQTSLERLEEVNKQLEEKKKDLKVAVDMADKANAVKMAAEQELRDWRASNEQRRRASDAAPSHLGSPPKSSDRNTSSGEAPLRINSVSCPDLYAGHSVPESKQRRKKSFFPRIVMFLARKKAQSLKEE